MKRTYHKIIVGGLCGLLLTTGSDVFAGNKDRVGQAGAAQLEFNPWARSSGMGGANTANAIGVESIFGNVAGLAYQGKTDLSFSYNDYLRGSGVSTVAFGFGQRIGETSVLALTLNSFQLGDIDITEVNTPEGGNGTFTPSIMNLGLSFAKEFSNTISAGATVKVISEGMADLNGSAVAFDMGIRYVTGEQENLKFGISLKNVGGAMQFDGDGLSTKVDVDGKEMTVNQRVEAFELPTSLNLGISYDYFIGESISGENARAYQAEHRITGMGNFMAKSFGRDIIQFGLEYAYMEKFMIRGGYNTEGDANEFSAFSGLSGGASLAWPINENGSFIAFDYAYRANNDFDGTHTIGLRVNL